MRDEQREPSRKCERRREKSERGRLKPRISVMKHALIFIAIVLVIIWLAARLTLAVTSVALHVLWIVAIILAVVWLIGRLKGP
jgi:cell division septal protein FtsQ